MTGPPPRPDFVNGVGDMIHGGMLQSLSPDTQLREKLQASLKMRFYPVVGNHENVRREGNSEYEAAFGSVEIVPVFSVSAMHGTGGFS